MLTPAKTAKEKPSIVSKKVLKTHHKNGTESYLLTEKIKALEHKHSQKNIDIDIEVNSLKKKMEAVQRVKEKISLSKERRMLLKSQGFTIRVCKSGAEDEIILRRDSDSLQVYAGKWANLLVNPPNLTPQDESLTLSQDAVESNGDPLESRTSGRIRSVSLSSVADSSPTQVSRYRVIEPPLRPGSRRGFTSLGTKSTLKNDQEVCEQFNDNGLSMLSSERAPTGWDVVKNRPWSGKSLFFEAVIAARDNYYFAHKRDAAKARMENYRGRKSLAGKRTMSAPVKVTSTTTILTNERKLENQPGEKKRLESCLEVKSSDYHDQKDLPTTKKDETFASMEHKLETSEKDKTSSERDLIKLSVLPVSSDSKVTFTLSIPQENTPVQDNTGNFAGEEKTKIRRNERNTENDCATNLLLINSDQTECNERSKCVDKFNEVRSIPTSKMSTGEVDAADVLNPVLLNGQDVLASEDTGGNKLCFKNKQQDYVVDSDTAIQTSSGKNYHSLHDRVSHMSIRRHSADGEIHNSRLRLHGNKARNEMANNDAGDKRHVTLQFPRSGMLNRRMSHPPRIVNIHEGYKLRKKKPLKNEDEIVYAYDARPDKSLAKGYRAMQMTVGGRQVKISMAAFPKEGKVQVDRAKLNAKLSSLQGKIKEPKLL